MGLSDQQQVRRAAVRVVVSAAAMANGSAPATPRAADARPADAGPQPTTPGTARRAAKHAADGGSAQPRGIPVALLLGACGLLLMLAGLTASEHTLRISKMGSLALPAPVLSTTAFSAAQQQQGQGATASVEDSLAALLASTAAVLQEQMRGESFKRRTGRSLVPGGTGMGLGLGGVVMPPTWQLRCAVVNNLVFHIDVMAGWTYAFQSAGCDVTVYQNEHSLGIEEIMSSWFAGRFRKPELFPGEAGDYHIVILPTFRDQHAELIQYLLQLPRLERQRYFLTQHNPDWLLNHPNVDIIQQQLLGPLLRTAHQRDEQAEATGVPAPSGRPPLLKMQLVTLAPCVSDYTLHFLKEMAFNVTEGHTYTERVGSFRVRSDTGGGAGEDNSEALRRWIDDAINVQLPWLSPLVPWEHSETPSETAAALAAPVGSSAGGAEAQRVQRERRLLWQLMAAEAEEEGEEAAGGKAESGAGGKEQAGKAAAEKAGEQAAGPAPPPKPRSVRWWLTGGAPPPPPPVDAQALSMLAKLNRNRTDDGPRHVCIQGKLENSRRNYSAAFEAVSHPAVMRHLRQTGERLLLLGHRSKWEEVKVPAEVQDVVVVLESLPYTEFFDTLSHCRAILLAFANDEYYSKKSSSTIAMALNVGVPLVAERRTLQAYNFLKPNACFVYDDKIAATAGGGKHKGGGKRGQRRLQDEAAAAAAGEPQAGSYSAAILSALRSESSAAARLAVHDLKGEVMDHNRKVAAAFMAATEGQYTAQERLVDAAWWQQRRRDGHG